jgi:hypothetical protein
MIVQTTAYIIIYILSLHSTSLTIILNSILFILILIIICPSFQEPYFLHQTFFIYLNHIKYYSILSSSYLLYYTWNLKSNKSLSYLFLKSSILGQSLSYYDCSFFIFSFSRRISCYCLEFISSWRSLDFLYYKLRSFILI